MGGGYLGVVRVYVREPPLDPHPSTPQTLFASWPDHIQTPILHPIGPHPLGSVYVHPDLSTPQTLTTPRCTPHLDPHPPCHRPSPLQTPISPLPSPPPDLSLTKIICKDKCTPTSHQVKLSLPNILILIITVKETRFVKEMSSIRRLFLL